MEENICQECGAEYDEDEFQDVWIGCDKDEMWEVVPLLVRRVWKKAKLPKEVHLQKLLAKTIAKT